MSQPKPEQGKSSAESGWQPIWSEGIEIACKCSLCLRVAFDKVPWTKYGLLGGGKKTPHGDQCAACNNFHQMSFPWLQWKELCGKAAGLCGERNPDIVIFRVLALFFLPSSICFSILKWLPLQGCLLCHPICGLWQGLWTNCCFPFFSARLAAQG